MPRVKWPLTPFGRAVKKRLVDLEPEFTMNDLCVKLGISQNFMQSLLRGRVTAAPTVKRIMKALDLTKEDIEREERLVG